MAAGRNHFLNLKNCIAMAAFLSLGQAVLGAGCAGAGEQFFRVRNAEFASADIAYRIVIRIGVCFGRNFLGFVLIAVFAIPALNALAG